jgi:hypothetical protein
MESSLYSMAALRFRNRIRLREHFRRMPEIIGFSDQLSSPLLSTKPGAVQEAALWRIGHRAAAKESRLDRGMTSRKLEHNWCSEASACWSADLMSTGLICSLRQPLEASKTSPP